MRHRTGQSLPCATMPTVMHTVIVEIRAAEGGDDAKLLVNEQTAIYCRLASRREL